MAKASKKNKRFNDQKGLHKMLRRVSSWSDFKDSLDRHCSPSQAGFIFEDFCKLYFLNEPSVKDDYKEVYLYDEIPEDLKVELNLPTIEHGIDLLLINNDGKYIAIQCKYRVDENSCLSWSKDKIANLYGFGIKCDAFAAFTNASQIDEVSRTRVENFEFYGIQNLLEIKPETFSLIKDCVKGKKSKPKKYTPQKHQEIAIDKVVKHFEKKNRGQLILPCGAGKTFTALWIKERLKPQTTLVLVPSLALLRAIKNEWASQKKDKYEYICVCSEKDIDKRPDALVVHTYEVGSRVTTRSETVHDFLDTSGEKIVFSTYQSLPVIIDAIKGSKFSFDFVVCDEAHRTAGAKKGNIFTLVHDNKILPAKKRLYMTATPRIASTNVKTKLGDDVKYLCVLLF